MRDWPTVSVTGRVREPTKLHGAQNIGDYGLISAKRADLDRHDHPEHPLPNEKP
jgi:hypothetical protein